jgi:hypothetical protein
VQAADSDNSPPGRAGRERRMILVTLAESGQEARDVLSADLLDLGPPGRSQGRSITTQVTPVGLQCVLGEAALYRQVVEITPDSTGEGCQLSTS